MNALPPAILFDMDDTILSAYGKPQAMLPNLEAAEFKPPRGKWNFAPAPQSNVDSVRISDLVDINFETGGQGG